MEAGDGSAAAAAAANSGATAAAVAPLEATQSCLAAAPGVRCAAIY